MEGKPLINTVAPANVQRVAATAFEDFGKDPERVMAEKPLFGPIIFTDGPIWKHTRAIVKPIFSRAEISDIDHFESYCNRFIALILDDGSMIDVQPLLDRLFLDVSMYFLFGKSLGFLHSEVPPEAIEFIGAFVHAQSYSIKGRESGWLHFHLFRYKNDD